MGTIRQIFVMMLLLLLSIQAAHVQAKSWRVNNDETKKAHFTDINAAMASEEVVDGDTLYMDPGCLLTSTQTISKSVTIIGCGYYTEQVAQAEATIRARINIKAARTKIESMVLTNGGNNSISIYISADHVTIERCLLNDFIRWDGQGRYFTLRQCMTTHCIFGAGQSNMNSTGCTIENCIIVATYTEPMIKDLQGAVIRNNYIRNAQKGTYYNLSNLSDAIITNNIILHVTNPNVLLTNISGQFTNNVLSCSESTYSYVSPTDNRCLGAANEADIVCMTESNDLNYQLKEDSPAKGFAMDGGDCGPYGGRYPYVPSGFPLGLPRVESSSVSKRSQDGQVSVTQTVSIQKQ